MTRQALRWWLGGVGALVLVPSAIVAVLVARLDPNDFKPELVDAVRRATGRQLTLGTMRLAKSLWPTLEADDVRLANLPGGSRPDMARAERISVALSLPALLHHRIEVSKLTLIGPNILFEQVKGKPNWRFDLPDDDDDPAPPSAFTLSIRDAHVQNGMVTWHLPARTKVLGIRIMDVSHPADGGPIGFGGTFVYSDNQPFRLTGSAQPTAGLAGPWRTRLDLAAFDTAATATGTMDTAGAYDLQLEATIGQLEKLNALLPEMQLPPVHGISLSSRLGNGRRNGDIPTVGATRLRFASADLRALAPGLFFGASRVDIDKPGGTATLTMPGTYAGQGFGLDGTVGVPLHPDDPVTLPLNLTARMATPGAATGTLAAKGTLALDGLAYAGLDATWSLSTKALAGWRRLVVPGLPALMDVTASARVVLPLHPIAVAFRAAKLTSAQGDLAGSGRFGLGDGLDLDGKLHADRLDLDATLAAFGMDLAPPAASAGRFVIPETPLNWHVLVGPALDLSIDAGHLRFLESDWAGVDLGLRLRGGRLERGALSLASAGGPIALAMTADAARAPVPVTVTVNAPALPLALVARYAGLPGTVSGTARVEARLAGSGGSLHALASTLDGTASLASVGGQLSDAAFIALTGTSLAALGTKVPPRGEVAIRCLGAAAAFRGGVGTIRPLALESTYLTLAGEGQVDLRTEHLELQLKPLATVSGSQVSVPVVVEGPFRNLSGRLDADLMDKLGLLLDAWFGGDRSTACADAGLLPPNR